jgi:predicted Zn-dependent protease
MLNKDQAKQLADKVLSFSKFPECAVSFNNSESASIRFALNGITTSGFTIDQIIQVTSSRNGQAGSSTTHEFTDAALKRAVEDSERIAMISPPNPEREEPIAPQKYPEQENYIESTAKARNEVMIPNVRAVIEAAKSKDLVSAGFIQRTALVTATANKRGNFGYGRTTDASFSTTIRAKDGSSSGWAGQPAIRIAEIDGAALAKTAVDKCLAWKNPVRLEPGKYTVVLEPTAVSDLVDRAPGSFQARAADEGRNFFSKPGGATMLGEKVFPDFITLISDPFNPQYSSLPWSNGGVPNERIAWIEKGVVKNFNYNRYWAAKTGKQPTPSPGSLVMEGTEKSLADLISSVERGLLVTRFWYIRAINPQTGQQTGLTRDGLFLIEKGKVTSPVINLRFNESPLRMLQNVIALGKPIRTQGGEGNGAIAPAMVVKDFPFTSVSDAV